MPPLVSAPGGFVFTNIKDEEIVYQRALLICGHVGSGDPEDFVIVSHDQTSPSSFPAQNWPISDGHFKALVILSPGSNEITLHQYHNGTVSNKGSLSITYIPLVETPPLHLAIMIAKDSPLLIDCPPIKRGGISSAHSDLDAAIKKFRMSAYMWQALTAEDMRSKGLGRRSFRLEEEWASETLSREFLQVTSTASQMRSTAKVHLIRSEKTVGELRDAQIAQQNRRGRRRDDLHKYFTAALKSHGGVFDSSARPVVAGLILDSTYSTEQDLVLAHAALGSCNTNGISLGMFGSHLTYSWPRFIEEVPSSLLDTVSPGDTVCNDNGECGTMWEACSIGQGAFLHEVGHAFGLDHTTGIMARGYAQDWPKNFLARTGFCAMSKTDGSTVVPDETPNNACWDLSDALHLKSVSHFRLPKDGFQSAESANTAPAIQVVFEESSEEFLRLVVSSPSGIVRVKFDGVEELSPTVAVPAEKLLYTMAELEARFDRKKFVSVEVLAMNGKSCSIGNIWRLFTSNSFVRIADSSIVLHKRSVKTKQLEQAENDESRQWYWTAMLKKNTDDGNLVPATIIDSRVGCVLDGAVVYYRDGHKTICGPRWGPGGHSLHMGGGDAQKIVIAPGVGITKIEIASRGHDEFNGLRFHLSDGTSGGYLNSGETIQTLEPAEDETIVGLYGRSKWGYDFNDIIEFGIITAPRDVELPMAVYEMPELQNTDGGTGPKGTRPVGHDSDDDNDSGTASGDDED